MSEVFDGALWLFWGHALDERWRLIGEEPAVTNKDDEKFGKHDLQGKVQGTDVSGFFNLEKKKNQHPEMGHNEKELMLWVFFLI